MPLRKTAKKHVIKKPAIATKKKASARLGRGFQVVEAEIVLPVNAELGEGAIWDARTQRLLWLDILHSILYRFDPQTGVNEVHDLSGYSKTVSTVVPLAVDEDPSGDRVGVTLREGFALYDFKTRVVTPFAGNPAVAEFERFNDGKVDPAGRFWAGTIARNSSGDIISGGFLYRRNTDGSIVQILERVGCSNGVVWASNADTMYYIDTSTKQVDAFDYDVSDGRVWNRRPVITGFDFDETGLPDGCAIDSEDMLWIAFFNGGCARRYNPRTGKLLAEARLPIAAGKQVTSCAFGGRNLADLYITTAREHLTIEAVIATGKPLAGCLFRVPEAAMKKIGAAPGQAVHAFRSSAQETYFRSPVACLVSPGRCVFGEQWTPAKLLAKTSISHDTKVFTFSLPDSSQPLGLSTCACLLAQAPVSGGDPVVRPYTPVSTNAMIGKFELMVKIYPGGKVSQHLNQLQIGDSMDFKHIPVNVKVQYPFRSGARGQPKKRIGMVVGGTGITPMIQALHALLGTAGNVTKVDMLYGSKTVSDILAKEMVDRWSAAHKDRFTVTHVLSHEPLGSSWDGERGFVGEELIKAKMPAPPEDCWLFICGPPPMYDALCGPRNEKELTGLLAKMGYKSEQVFKF